MTRVWLGTQLGRLGLFGACAAALSCGDTTVTPGNQLNLDRPVDISFACYGNVRIGGPTGTITPTAQPAQWCNLRSPVYLPPADVALGTPAGQEGVYDPAAKPPTPAGPSWFGFILQSASGTMAVAQIPAQPDNQFVGGLSTAVNPEIPVLDADPRSPGKNAISVGEEPIALINDLSGCFEVTANAGSCDLSAVDINSVLTTNAATQVRVTRLAVTNGNGDAIRAKPSAMVVQSNAAAPVGNACTANPSGLAYIAYPGCHVVAGVDLATGKVQAGIRFAGGVASVLSPADVAGLSCPDECAGAAPADDTRPASLSIQEDPSHTDLRQAVPRLAIGADNSGTITVVNLDPTTLLPAATAPLQIALSPPPAGSKALGITAVALSPQIAMGNSTRAPRRNNNVPGDPNDKVITPDPNGVVLAPDAIGASPGGEGQYVYAVANDGSVRVADVLNVRKECDTQVDMRFVRSLTAVTDIPKLQCFPVGDPATPRRRSGARGPGIETPADGPPVSVTIIKGVDRPAQTTSVPTDGSMPVTTDVPPTPGMLIGYFAIVSVSSGQVYVVNIDDDDGPDKFDPTNPFATAPVLVTAHQLRDAFADRSQPAPAGETQCTASDPTSTVTGSPRSLSGPGIAVPTNANNTTPKANELAKSSGLPTLQQEKCVANDGTKDLDPVAVSQIQLNASAATRDFVYPDLRGAKTETWLATWEGTLSNDPLNQSVDGPPIRTGQIRIDQFGIHMVDQTQPFCDMGVEPFDFVQLRGCDASRENLDCPSGYTCYVHKDNRVPNLGSCMLTAEAPRLADACAAFLTSVRRYTVARAETGELALVPRKHELSTTPVDGCTSNDQCTTLANYAAVLRTNVQPGAQPGVSLPVDGHAWQCLADDARKPVASGKRCVEVCDVSADCDAGTVCVGGTTAGARTGTCMESVLPPQSCVNGPQRFEVHASEAFALTGTRSGYVHPIIAQGTGPTPHACVRDPAASSLQIGRIPLDAPACEPADPFTGALTAGGGFQSNPCSTTVTTYDAQPQYSGGVCTTTTVLAPRSAPAIQFRNRSMTIDMVDPWSPGDLSCVEDRQGALGKIPLLLPAPFDTPFLAGYQLTFDQKAGYTALPVGGVSLLPAFPVKVVRGPSNSIWVMDNGDFIATQIGQSSTSGQVYRASVTNLLTLDLLQ